MPQKLPFEHLQMVCIEMQNGLAPFHYIYWKNYSVKSRKVFTIYCSVGEKQIKKKAMFKVQFY